jgi:hypothetical protein
MAGVNAARADPGFAHDSLVNSRGVAGAAEEDRVAAGVEARRAVQNSGDAVGGDAQVVVDGQMAPEEAAGPAGAPLTLASELNEDTSARVLSEAIFKKEAGEIAAASSPSEALRFTAGLGKCAGSFLCAVPMVRAFMMTGGTFTRALQRFNGIAPV